MTTGKAGPAPSLECCMCGDYGLSTELFNCKVCQSRTQHRYCSNQYPKAESYRVCNWCLIQTEKTQVSPNNSSSSNKTPSSQDHDHEIKKKKKLFNGSGSDHNHGGQKGSSPFQIPVNTPIKKLIRSPEESPAAATARKRVITGGGLEGRLTRTKSAEISNGGTLTKQVFRNKVRRYKLLDEVSSQ